MKHAIIGTDFSKVSYEIVENSSEFQLLGIGKITLVFVLNLRNNTNLENVSLEFIEKELAKQKILLASKGFGVDAKMVYGIPAIELMKQVKLNDAHLLIIGSHGKTWSPSALGSIASEILHNTQMPVMLMRFKKLEKEEELEAILMKDLYQYERIMKELERKEPESFLLKKDLGKHVLLTTDFSDFSENAFQWLKINFTNISKLTLLHIQDEERIEKYLKEKLHEFNLIDTERLKRLKEAFNKVHPETEINIVLEYGRPKQLILNYIHENNVTLTVMGSQGRGYFSEVFLGSVSHHIARDSSSNVLLIPLKND